VTDVTEDSDTEPYGLSTTSSTCTFKKAMRGSALVYGLDQLVLAFRIFSLAFLAFLAYFEMMEMIARIIYRGSTLARPFYFVTN